MRSDFSLNNNAGRSGLLSIYTCAKEFFLWTVLTLLDAISCKGSHILSLYVCMYVCTYVWSSHTARARINRVRLPILLVVS